MYKLIFLADLHLKDTETVGGIDETGRSLRTVDKINHLNSVFKYGIDNNIDAIIIGGDLYDNNSPSNRLRSIVSKSFSKVLKNNIKIYIIGGNHDTNDNISFNMMSESHLTDNLIFAKNTNINTNEGIQLKLLSWGQDELIEKMQIFTPTILFAHMQIEGAKYDNERLAAKFTKISSLSKFKRVYLGHFHKRQSIGNCIYVGALCRNTFGERNNPAGFLFIGINGGEIVTEKFIDIPDREFFQFEQGVLSEEEIYNHLDSINITNNLIKGIYKIPSDLTIHRRKIKEYALSKNPFDIFLEYDRENEKVDVIIEKSLGFLDAFNKYIEIKKPNKKYIKTGESILRGVFEN